MNSHNTLSAACLNIRELKMVAARGAKTSSSTRESDAATDSSRCASPTAECLKLYDIMTRDAVEQGKLLPRTDHVLGFLARIDHSTIASQAKAYAFLDLLLAGFPFWASAKISCSRG